MIDTVEIISRGTVNSNEVYTDEGMLKLYGELNNAKRVAIKQKHVINFTEVNDPKNSRNANLPFKIIFGVITSLEVRIWPIGLL